MRFNVKGKIESHSFAILALCGLFFVFGCTIGYGFVAHHDGLILVNVDFLYNSIISGGSWPFNQYGSFWIFPYLAIRTLFGRENLLYNLRIVTLILYLLNSYLLFKCAQSVYGRRIGYVAVVFYLATQPFAFDLLPWPSAIANTLFLTMVYLALQFTSATFGKHNSLKIFIFGILSLLLVLSRVQLGLLVFCVAVTLLVRYKSKALLPFLSGFLGACLVSGLLAQKLGWLTDLIYDSFIFPFRYILWDGVVHPKPIGLIGATALCIVMLSMVSFADRSTNAHLHLLLRFLPFPIIFFTVLSTYLYLSLAGTTIVSNLYSFFGIKLWMALVLSSVFLSITKDIRGRLHGNFLIAKTPVNESILLLSCLISLTQMWPLFDPMHFWWGASIGFIFLGKILMNLFALKIRKMILVSLMFFILIPFSTIRIQHYISSFNATVGNNHSSFLKNIREDFNSIDARDKLFKVVSKEVSRGSVVLNLCEDSTIFLSDAEYRSASRFYVYWPSLMSLNESGFGILIHKPDVIISCTPMLTRETPQDRLVKEKFIEKAIDNLKVHRITFVESKVRVWDVIVLKE
jgi:hypothetical protein